MAKIADVQEVSLKKLRPYERNAKRHDAEQVEKIAASIKEFGFISPCLIDAGYNLIAGHGRMAAAKMLGLESVPCVFVEGLNEEQRRAYILADNRLGELAAWDFDLVFDELNELGDLGFDVNLTGFEVPASVGDWFENREKEGKARQDGNDEYNDFLEKFEPKKTTDDCYTPEAVYDAVAEYVAKTYDLKRESFVRPFYPGGDYQAEKYPDGCVVVDNPPFSILAEITRFYQDNGQPFFLFAPSLTCLNRSAEVTAILCDADIEYENGARVRTAFLTNLEPECAARTAPDLREKLIEAQKGEDTTRPVYTYPDEIVTAAMLQKMAKYGVEFAIKKSDSTFIRKLDAQVDAAIYGGGLLLSEKAAAEKAAVWELSDREKEIVKSLGDE